MYSVGEFAEKIGKSVKTLQKWDRDGVFKANRTATNRRYYTQQQYLEYKGIVPKCTSAVVAYCRVSSSSQKSDLQNQINYIYDFAKASGFVIDELLTDIGSGLNFKRKNFISIMERIEAGEIRKLVLAHKDRLVRFGFDWFSKFLSNHGVELVVINDERLSPEEEVVKDLISIIHVFSCKVYGLRKYTKQISEDKL